MHLSYFPLPDVWTYSDTLKDVFVLITGNNIKDSSVFSNSPEKGRLPPAFNLDPTLLPGVVSSDPTVKQRIEPYSGFFFTVQGGGWLTDSKVDKCPHGYLLFHQFQRIQDHIIIDMTYPVTCFCICSFKWSLLLKVNLQIWHKKGLASVCVFKCLVKLLW